jgi:exopolysaccharide biosynthesis operon protein EpsL
MGGYIFKKQFFVWPALLLMFNSSTALALPEDVLRPYVSYTESYDDNLLRFNNASQARALLGNGEMADTIGTETVGLILNKQLSLQNFDFRMELDHNDFNHFSVLDNYSGNLSGKWNWHLGTNLEGNLGTSYVRSLASFTDFRPIVNGMLRKNMLDQTRTFADIAWRLHPSWSLNASISAYDLGDSEVTQRVNDRNETAKQIGFDYLPSTGSSVGIRLTRTDGEFTGFELVPGDLRNKTYEDNEASIVADWLYSGKTHMKLKLGMISKSFDQQPSQNFEEPNGRLDVDWFVTGKTTLSMSAWRDIYAVEEIASFVDSKGVSLSPSWAVTSKITLRGRLSYEERKQAGVTNQVAAVPPIQDTIRSALMAIIYEPLLNLKFTLSRYWLFSAMPLTCILNIRRMYYWSGCLPHHLLYLQLTIWYTGSRRAN